MTNKSIQVVVVLYGMRAEQSVALQTFMHYSKALVDGFHLCIYNNSTDITVDYPQAEVVNAPSNDGLAKAYNHALSRAEQHGCPWLLLLDQDTELTEEYLVALSRFVRSADSEKHVAAVPRLLENGIQMSPTTYRAWRGVVWRQNPLRSTQKSFAKGEVVTAFNSGALMNVTMLRLLNGFDEQYPLDMLDHRMFYRFHQKGLPVAVLSVELAHSLSENGTMGNERYQAYLMAHRRWAAQLGWRTLAMFRLRMLLRWIQLWGETSAVEKRKSTFHIIFK